MTQERRESLIGDFEAPEITPACYRTDPVLAQRGVGHGIVTTASSPFSTSLLFRTGGHNTFFIFDATPLATLASAFRNTKSSVWYEFPSFLRTGHFLN